MVLAVVLLCLIVLHLHTERKSFPAQQNGHSATSKSLICFKVIFTRMSMALSNYLVSWVVIYLEDLQPTYIGVIIYLLSTMDIPVLSTITMFHHHLGVHMFGSLFPKFAS